ncbi:hypothetical protein [Staphylococcus sp. GDX8P66P]|nr:hypothetical protein [Staphylococcus sp. GDX8P66P]
MSIENVRTYQQLVYNLLISRGQMCGYALFSEYSTVEKLHFTCG